VPNPYHYGTPVTGEQFTGRQAETAALESRMRDGINVVLSSPRRYGKTSLLARATATLTEQGASVVWVNVLACKDLATFASRLATGAYQSKGGRWHRLRQGVAEFVSRLRVSPTITFDGDHPRFTFAPGLAPEDADSVIEDVYALLGELSDKKPAIMVLDEFQAITALGAHLPGLLKALADTHPTVSLVIAGSRQHLMEQLTADRTAPLYGLAERISLDVLPASVMADFLRGRAKHAGKNMPAETADRIIALAGPVPNDIQRLAYEAWGVASRTITVQDVEEAMSRAVQHEASSYSETYGQLAAGQRRIISTLAAGPVSEPYAAAFAHTVGLATGASVQKALAALVSAELVTRRDGSYEILDPFFAAWLKQTL
jgi:uncharacterized protein